MKLERGINLGGYLSQCVHNTEHYDAFIQEEDIRKIASMDLTMYVWQLIMKYWKMNMAEPEKRALPM